MSNLLEKASILTTPTAYDDGKILSVKPAPSLGSELVTNGTFDTDSDWTKQTSWSISGGAANYDFLSDAKYIRQTLLSGGFVAGKVYKINFDITSGTAYMNVNSNGGGLISLNTYSVGSYSIQVTASANGSDLLIYGRNTSGTGFSIDNVSVKEVIDGDFDFTRNSSATRVNSQGLVEDVQILSSNLVQNGDFSQEGLEQITNGDFATDSDWNKGTGWSIANGTASHTGNASYLSQSVLQADTQYKVNISVTSVSGGGFVQIYMGNSPASVFISAIGDYTYYLTSQSSGVLGFALRSLGNVSIDNVSVKEVGQDWTFGTGWSIGANKAIATDAAFGAQIVDDTTLVANKKYKVTFDISDYVKGNVRVGVGNAFSSEVSSNGSFTFIITSSNTNAFKAQTRAGGSGTTLSISNISVIEITDDTNLPRINYEGFSYQDALGSELITNGDFATDSNWNKINSTISDGTGNLNGTGVTSLLYQNILTNGKTYKVTFTASDYNGLGEARIIESSGSAIYTITSNGTFTFTFTHSNADGDFLFRAKNGAIFSVDNVSVKEYLGQEVVPDSGVGNWLFEPQSTNLITYSEDFSQSYWRKDKITVTDNSIISPSGQLDASLIQETVYTSGIPSLDLSNSITLSGTYTYTFYVKNNNGRYLGISFGSNAERIRTNFDFNTNTFKTLIFNGTTTGLASFTNLGDYYRISITATFPSSTVADIVLMPLATDTYPFFDFQNSDNRSFYLWGAQLEQSSFATSYIPTNGSTVTRLQDAAFGAGSSDLINSTEGVLYAEIAALANTSDASKFITISDGTYNNRASILFSSGSTNQIRAFLRVGGVSQIDVSHNVTDVTDFNKVAFSYKENDFKVYINGSLVSSDTNGSVWSENTISKLSFSEINTSAGLFNGNVKSVAVFKEALTDEELTCLTTI